MDGGTVKQTLMLVALLHIASGLNAQSLDSLKGRGAFAIPEVSILAQGAQAVADIGPAVALASPKSAAAERIARATWAAPENLKKGSKGGVTTWLLYGRVINDAATKYGRLACARVASTILNKAGVGVGVTDGVGDLESQLRSSRWEKIESVTALEPGDVIVWRKRFADDACTGGGDCHVGIYWGTGLAYDNDGKLGYPIRYPVAPRVAFAFKVAYRAR